MKTLAITSYSKRKIVLTVLGIFVCGIIADLNYDLNHRIKEKGKDGEEGKGNNTKSNNNNYQISLPM